MILTFAAAILTFVGASGALDWEAVYTDPGAQGALLRLFGQIYGGTASPGSFGPHFAALSLALLGTIAYYRHKYAKLSAFLFSGVAIGASATAFCWRWIEENCGVYDGAQTNCLPETMCGGLLVAGSITLVYACLSSKRKPVA